MAVDPAGIGNGIFATAFPAIQNIQYNRSEINYPPIQEVMITSNGDNVTNANFIIQFENTNVQWLTSSGNVGGPILFMGGSAMLPLNFQNLEQLPANNYRANIYLNLANSVDPSFEIVVTVNLTLSGVAADSIRTEKTVYDLIYNRADDTLSGETDIVVLNNSSDVDLVFDTSLGHFASKTFKSTFLVEQNTTKPLANFPGLPYSGVVNITGRFRVNNTFIYYFTFRLTIIEDDGIIVSPNSLDFLLRRDFDVNQKLSLSLINPLNLTYQVTRYPNWLKVSQLSGNSSVNLDFTTVNVDTLPTGIKQDIVEITYGEETVEVPVKLTVTDFISYEIQDLYFCEDDFFISSTKTSTEALSCKFVVTIHLSDNEIIENTYLIPYFNDKTKFNAGKVIQGFIAENEFVHFNSEALDIQKVFTPVMVDIKVQELDYNNQVVTEKTLNSFRCISGSKPKLFPFFTDITIIGYQPEKPLFFTFYSTEDTQLLFDAPLGHVFSATVNNHSLLNQSYLSNHFSIELLPVESAPNPILLQWNNGNKMPNRKVLSGKNNQEFSYEFVRDENDVKQKFDTKKTTKVFASTGFLFKEEEQIVDEIIRSNKCWLLIDNILYEGYCSTNKLVLNDTENDLREYQLEFTLKK